MTKPGGYTELVAVVYDHGRHHEGAVPVGYGHRLPLRPGARHLRRLAWSGRRNSRDFSPKGGTRSRNFWWVFANRIPRLNSRLPGHPRPASDRIPTQVCGLLDPPYTLVRKVGSPAASGGLDGFQRGEHRLPCCTAASPSPWTQATSTVFPTIKTTTSTVAAS